MNLYRGRNVKPHSFLIIPITCWSPGNYIPVKKMIVSRAQRLALLARTSARAASRSPAFLGAQQQAFSRAFSTGKVGEGSHSDFQRQSKAPSESKKDSAPANETAEIFNVQEWLGQVVKEHPVLLFMKGSPQSPRCGFSASVVHILNDLECEFASADILENEDVRQGLKTFSNWPTFPQLYVGGEFVGGADIVAELNKSGGLKPMLQKAGAVKPK
jgi:monothiol glutaredoxin